MKSLDLVGASRRPRPFEPKCADCRASCDPASPCTNNEQYGELLLRPFRGKENLIKRFFPFHQWKRRSGVYLERQVAYRIAIRLLHRVDSDVHVAVLATRLVLFRQVWLALGFARFHQSGDHDHGRRPLRPHHQPEIVDGVAQRSLRSNVGASVAIVGLPKEKQKCKAMKKDSISFNEPYSDVVGVDVATGRVRRIYARQFDPAVRVGQDVAVTILASGYLLHRFRDVGGYGPEFGVNGVDIFEAGSQLAPIHRVAGRQ